VIDFIFGVNHAQHWHSLNLRQHPHHYSGVKHLGSKILSLLQQHIGAGIYYNTHVRLNGHLIKYGVIAIDDLCDDLNNWTHLYAAGRLHKPVSVLRHDGYGRVDASQRLNLKHALRTSLLLLPPKFSLNTLLHQLTALSYTGDLRYTLKGEDPLKVERIVRHHRNAFKDMYMPIVEAIPQVTWSDEQKEQLVQDKRTDAVAALIRELPPRFQSKVIEKYRRLNAHKETLADTQRDDFVYRLIQELAAAPPDVLSQCVTGALKETVFQSSLAQTMKGIVTAGVPRSVVYAMEKLRKANRGRKETNK
jgi:translocator assembly and maintenance protein 41